MFDLRCKNESVWDILSQRKSLVAYNKSICRSQINTNKRCLLTKFLLRWDTHLYMSLFLPVCLSIHPSVGLSVGPSIRPSVRPSIHLSVCLSVHPSIRLLHTISQELQYSTDCDFWYTCVKWWYLKAFFHFFQIYFSGCYGGKRAKNSPKWKITITSVTHHMSGTV